MPATIDLWLAMAAGVILLALAVYAATGWLQHRSTRKRLTTLSKLGSQHNLSFSSQEKIAGGLFGFDNLNKILLVLENGGAHPKWYLVHLAQVRFCCVRRVYRETGLPEYPLHESIDKVGLEFHFKSGEPPVFLAFFSAQSHPAQELPHLEAKARGWHSFLSKMLRTRQSCSWSER